MGNTMTISNVRYIASLGYVQVALAFIPFHTTEENQRDKQFLIIGLLLNFSTCINSQRKLIFVILDYLKKQNTTKSMKEVTMVTFCSVQN